MKRAFDKYELATFEFLFEKKIGPLKSLKASELPKNILGKLTGEFVELVELHWEQIPTCDNARQVIKFFEEMT